MKYPKIDLPKVAIIGRPNVGKSTLFNKISQKRKAVVEKGISTTRDRLNQIISHKGISFEIIDTAGMDFDNKADIAVLTEKQITSAITQADIILFVCDVQTGIMPLDERVCDYLRKFNKETILVVNKVDNNGLLKDVMEFYNLGLGDPIPVSCIHGTGIRGLVDKIISYPQCEEGRNSPSFVDSIKLAVVGRPNAGKSLFVNAVLGEERLIVSPEPGTTRDSVDVYFEKEGRRFSIIDTAGFRYKKKIKDPVTYFSILRTAETIKKSDIVIFLIDGSFGITKEDFKIIDIIQEREKPFIMAVNKWDICKKQGIDKEQYEKAIRNTLKFIYNAPIIFISALTGEHIQESIRIADTIAERARKNFSTSLLNDVLKKIPVTVTKVYSIRQINTAPPEFELIVKRPEAINQSIKNYIIKRLRQALGIEGVPIKIVIRKKRYIERR